MRAGAFVQFAASAKEAFAARAVDAPPIGIHSITFGALIVASLYLRGLGRFEESAAEMARAAEQDPLNATWQAIWAAHLIDAHRVDEAMDIARRSVEIDPTYFPSHNMLGEASWAAGLRDYAWPRSNGHPRWRRGSGSRPAGWRRCTGWPGARTGNALLATAGPTSKPLWGHVVYHVLTSELDAAADWYEQMTLVGRMSSGWSTSLTRSTARRALTTMRRAVHSSTEDGLP